MLNFLQELSSSTRGHKNPNHLNPPFKCLRLDVFVWNVDPKVECRSNVDPKGYVMSRRDLSTKERHVKRRHPGSTLNKIKIFNFESHGSDLENACQLYFKCSSTKSSKKDCKVPINQRLISSDFTQSNVMISKTLQKHSNSKPLTDTYKQSSVVCNTADKRNEHLDPEGDLNANQTDLATLNSKLDHLIETVKDLKLTEDSKPVLRQSVLDFQCVSYWKDIKNIVDLTENRKNYNLKKCSATISTFCIV